MSLVEELLIKESSLMSPSSDLPVGEDGASSKGRGCKTLEKLRHHNDKGLRVLEPVYLEVRVRLQVSSGESSPTKDNP